MNEDGTVEKLELVVTGKSVGFLDTNISKLEEYVDSELEKYKPELFTGDADLAKKKRAYLNKSKDALKSARINLIRELMQPYSDFETRCKNLEKKIDVASCALDEIVKEKENEEKECKRKKIEVLWQSKNFDLFTLDKIFNQRWLNKTFKESDISNEMDSIIKRTFNDLKSIERYSDDVDTIKAHYLITLDIGETFDYAEELKKQKEVADREFKERVEREHKDAIEKQSFELEIEKQKTSGKEAVLNLVSEALETTVVEEKKEFVFTVKCSDRQVLDIKDMLNKLDIQYSVEELEF